MKVKNIWKSPIGFGSVNVLPDETATLPKCFDENHPVIKFYISRKWVEIVDDNAGGVSSVPVGARVETLAVVPTFETPLEEEFITPTGEEFVNPLDEAEIPFSEEFTVENKSAKKPKK